MASVSAAGEYDSDGKCDVSDEEDERLNTMMRK
jgi:hypothetical protein